MSQKKGRIFSGMRPTGRLHLGNYLGALQNWVNLQDDYECIYCVVDVHALTTLESVQDTKTIGPNIHEMVLDWLAAGIDPNKSIIFVQSQVPEVMTLHTLLSMVTPLGWLMRVPTFKEKLRQMKANDETVNYGLVGYPVLQTADIILYKGDTVPVGEDQVPHVELSREIVRRFNTFFGYTFPEPKAKLTKSPSIKGLDGKAKMSKTLDNHVELALSDDETRKKIMSAVTDPQRTHRNIPGRPDVCNVYSLHNIFNTRKVNEIREGCTSATLGCVDCKIDLSTNVNKYLAPFRERRTAFANQPELVQGILTNGAEKAREIAKSVMSEVLGKMGL
jgi:tryptophanyl-tRNA synthetase